MWLSSRTTRAPPADADATGGAAGALATGAAWERRSSSRIATSPAPTTAEAIATRAAGLLMNGRITRRFCVWQLALTAAPRLCFDRFRHRKWFGLTPYRLWPGSGARRVADLVTGVLDAIHMERGVLRRWAPRSPLQ